jgi:hypothetical protein
LNKSNVAAAFVVVATVAVVSILVSKKEQTIPNIVEGAARHMGVSPEWFRDWGKICDRAQFSHEISDSDFKFIEDSFQDKMKRGCVIVVLGDLRHSKFRQQAIDLTEKALLIDSDIREREHDVVALMKLGSPDWKEKARPFFSDPETKDRAGLYFKELASEFR